MSSSNWIFLCLHFQLTAYGGFISYTVSYKTDQQEQTAIRVTSEPDLIIEVSFINQTQIKTLNTDHVPAQNVQLKKKSATSTWTCKCESDCGRVHIRSVINLFSQSIDYCTSRDR